MFRKQSFWKGSALLLASAMIAKLLGACFKIPLTNVLGGTGMGYFSTAYGLLLPVYALSVTGLSAAVAQTVSRAAALEHWAEVRRIRDTGTPCLRRPGAVPQPVYVPAGRAVRRPGCGAAPMPCFRCSPLRRQRCSAV